MKPTAENQEGVSPYPAVKGSTLPANGNTSGTHKASKLVLFDFDGTITTRDTLVEFVMFYCGRRKYYSGLLVLAPQMTLYALKILPNWKAKEFFLSHFFKGSKVEDFNAKCLEFSRMILPALIRPGALKAIEKYKAQGATVAVVSASSENWVKPWCDALGLICLATELEVSDGTISGKIKGRNCYGDEKVCRVQNRFKLSDYEEIIAYGDSAGDKEMLALAHQSLYKPFRDR